MKKKVLISGGGTGGHVFPAIAIANAVKAIRPDTEFLFVGAHGKIEMTKVPEAGYPIKGLWISGFARKLTLKNLLFPFKLLHSLIKAFFIVRKFKPDVAVGVGGYASGPTLQVANWLAVPSLIQEANSYPGITNKLLGSKADVICVAYDKMDRFFDAEKIHITGNPIRKSILEINVSRDEAAAYFGLNPDKPIIFITGGSGGARAINDGIKTGLDKIKESDVQLIWQTGRVYLEEYKKYESNEIKVLDFIKRMDCAYSAADIIISRAGGTIAELCIIGKPAILLPSANVTEDHQTKNVLALSDKDAAILVKDTDANESLVNVALELLKDDTKKQSLSKNIKALAKPESAENIAIEVLKLAGHPIEA